MLQRFSCVPIFTDNWSRVFFFVGIRNFFVCQQTMDKFTSGREEILSILNVFSQKKNKCRSHNVTVKSFLSCFDVRCINFYFFFAAAAVDIETETAKKTWLVTFFFSIFSFPAFFYQLFADNNSDEKLHAKAVSFSGWQYRDPLVSFSISNEHSTACSVRLVAY